MCESFSTESDDDWCGLVQDLVVSGRIAASVDMMVPSFVWPSSDIEMCLECFCLRLMMKVRVSVSNLRARLFVGSL